MTARGHEVTGVHFVNVQILNLDSCYMAHLVCEISLSFTLNIYVFFSMHIKLSLNVYINKPSDWGSQSGIQFPNRVNDLKSTDNKFQGYDYEDGDEGDNG